MTIPRIGATGIPTGECLEKQGNSVVICFPGSRNVLSTSWLNGGFQTELMAVINNQIPIEACEACHNGREIRTYLEAVASDHGFDPAGVTVLVTRAEVKNTAIVSETFRDLTVTAIVTAGIDKNGGRTGDPASYYENNETFEPVGGTINTILIIGADLPEYAMSRALMTAAEAKAAALQQLMARSVYSSGIATGSGTDMIAITADPGSPLHLSDAGKHAKLGELIGKSVMRATTSALEMETGLSAISQRDAMTRLLRYEVTEEKLWTAIAGMTQSQEGAEEKEKFLNDVKSRATDPGAVARVAAALHLVDEAKWGLISVESACMTIDQIFPDSDSNLTGTLSYENPLRALISGFSRWVYQDSCKTGTFRKHSSEHN